MNGCWFIAPETSEPPDIPDSENPMVWCDRCGREHRKWTFTKKDRDEMIAEAGRRLAEAIDQQAAEAALAALDKRHGR